jgi:hypothetical protein
VLNELGFEISSFPKEVAHKKQNISIKFSPASINIELITQFNPNKSFDDAYNNAIPVILTGQPLLRYHVLKLEDLIASKAKSGRTKDLLDIQELKRINKLD